MGVVLAARSLLYWEWLSVCGARVWREGAHHQPPGAVGKKVKFLRRAGAHRGPPWPVGPRPFWPGHCSCRRANLCHPAETKPLLTGVNDNEDNKKKDTNNDDNGKENRSRQRWQQQRRQWQQGQKQNYQDTEATTSLIYVTRRNHNWLSSGCRRSPWPQGSATVVQYQILFFWICVCCFEFSTRTVGMPPPWPPLAYHLGNCDGRGYCGSFFLSSINILRIKTSNGSKGNGQNKKREKVKQDQMSSFCNFW